MYNNWLAGDMLNPPVKDRMRGFSVLRFMDYTKTNTVFNPLTQKGVDWDGISYDFPEMSWAQRAKSDNLLWGYRGAPTEFVVALANRLNANPWITLPINASDDYFLNFATYLRDNLNPGLVARIELSNEVWNSLFRSNKYARLKGELAFEGRTYKHMDWLGMRTAQMSQIIRPVFAATPGRIKIVINVQWGQAGAESGALNTPFWFDANGNHIKASAFMDELAVAPYFYASMGNNYYDTIKKWWQTEPDRGISKAFDILWIDFNGYNAGRHQYFGNKAAEHGLDYITYEAGYHELTPDSRRSDTAFTAFLNALPRYSEMGKIEEQNVRNFAAAGGKLFTNYQLISAAGPDGSWGLFEHHRQNSSPRLRALQSFMPNGGQ